MSNTYKLKELIITDDVASSATVAVKVDSGEVHNVSFKLNGTKKIESFECPLNCITEAETFLNGLGDLTAYNTDNFINKFTNETQLKKVVRYIL